MAAPISAKRLLMVGALVMVVAMLAAQPTEANGSAGGSSFVFFSGPCSGDAAVLDACGCSAVPSNTRGGYQFTFTMQTAAAYNEPGCTGQAATRFEGGGTQQCYPVGWQSVFIQC